MRRADRLFQIVQLLRRRRTVTTAKEIARRLEISERTVYRDISDLVLAGTPIDGEAGVGYRIRPGYDLPPLMFDREEIQALVLGVRIVRQVGDSALARASESILSKVATVLPKELEPLLADTRLFATTRVRGSQAADALAVTREGLTSLRRIRMHYTDERGEATERTVRPLGVSERTVYRDVRDLVLAGTPIDGEAGVGYRIRPGYDLPPLMFDRDEIQALVLGARIVRQYGDATLARASDSILNKAAAVVPRDRHPRR